VLAKFRTLITPLIKMLERIPIIYGNFKRSSTVYKNTNSTSVFLRKLLRVLTFAIQNFSMANLKLLITSL
jgi:hypothetical protein